MAIDPTISGWPAGGECRLGLVGSNVVLLPCNGRRVVINGDVRIIPSEGLSISPMGLTVGMLHYVYIGDNGGALELSASASSGHITDATTGIQVMDGDPTKTFVGWVVPQAGPAFVNSPAKQLVRSFYNDLGCLGRNALSLDTSLSVNAWTELSVASRVEVISRGENLRLSVVGCNYVAAASGKLIGTSVGIDGVAPQDGPYVSGSPQTSSGSNFTGIGASWTVFVPEGKHFMTLLGRSYDAAIGTWKGNSDAGSARCALEVSSGSGGAAGDGSYIDVAGVIRPDASGYWSLIQDEDHEALNVAGVSQDATGIIISFTFAGRKVLTGGAWLDETLASTSQVDKVGPSIGLNSMTLWLGKIDGNGNTSRINPNSVNSASGNLWFWARFKR